MFQVHKLGIYTSEYRKVPYTCTLLNMKVLQYLWLYRNIRALGVSKNYHASTRDGAV